MEDWLIDYFRIGAQSMERYYLKYAKTPRNTANISSFIIWNYFWKENTTISYNNGLLEINSEGVLDESDAIILQRRKQLMGN